MHRNDMTTDLETVYILTGSLIAEKLKRPVASFTDLLASNPRAYVHGGLAYLHEIAQDDAGYAREMQRLDDTISDLAIQVSRDTNEVIDPFTYYRN